MDIYFYTKIVQNYTGTNIIYTINIETEHIRYYVEMHYIPLD